MNTPVIYKFKKSYIIEFNFFGGRQVTGTRRFTVFRENMKRSRHGQFIMFS